MNMHEYFVSFNVYSKRGNRKFAGCTVFSSENQLFGGELLNAAIEECKREEFKNCKIIPVCISYLGTNTAGGTTK